MRKSGYALNYWFCMDFYIIMAMSVKFSFFWQSGERVRLAYEKKCTQLQNQESKGDDPSTLEKTKATLRDLHTQIKVSIHSIEAISKRIETLRDEELHPQLLELVQGYVTSLLFPSFSLGYFVLKSAYRTVNLYNETPLLFQWIFTVIRQLFWMFCFYSMDTFWQRSLNS